LSDLGPLNRASHQLVVRFGDLSFRSILRRWRAEVLGLPPAASWLSLKGRPVEKLYPYSPAIVPVPDDWGADSHVTGSWFLDEAADFRPPDALSAFLAAGPPPVYVGFGSLPADDARQRTALVIAALQQAEQRGVLATGWGGLAGTDLPHGFYQIEQAPHDCLFPRMAAVVHHGGAGTTAAGLRAGRPSVICPVFGDQPFWGRRVHMLGAGPRPIPRRKLTVAGLAAAVTQAVSDAQMRQRAAALGQAISAERGLENAMDLIETALNER
jgi:UDP:flavonoid glycosyltransferase YjiC (YdhE family)